MVVHGRVRVQKNKVDVQFFILDNWGQGSRAADCGRIRAIIKSNVSACPFSCILKHARGQAGIATSAHSGLLGGEATRAYDWLHLASAAK